MTPIVPVSKPRSSYRRGSLLLASCGVRMAAALVPVAVIWLGTAWALGWF
ncbi:MAG: hypothetical protein GX772_04270 [Alcaligenaceae bacterium]|nr:hypothetical protein [Alcaligenaceae bacterium]